MNIIDVQTVVDYILKCPFIDEFRKVFTDFIDANADVCGVFDDGEQAAQKTDLLGNAFLPHNYALVARVRSLEDVERIRASNFCQRFQQWILEQDQLSNYPTLPEGYQPFKITAYNGRLTARDKDGKTSLYEIPITLYYWRFVQ